MASESPIISSELDPLAPHFDAWRAAGRRALIPYITAGYPAPADTAALLDAIADAGADIIELGVPFSDPVADGPTIQRASQRALEQGVNLPWTLSALRAFRARRDTPVVLFTYLNPVIGFGVERFIDAAVDAGAAGVLLTDLPVGADAPLERSFLDSPLALIRLVAPTTAPARMLAIARGAQGFLYYVGRMGVTGARAELRADTLAEVAALRTQVDVPVAVGFGVSTAAQAARIGRIADGVVVGSALIDALDSGGVAAASALLRGMRAELDALAAGPQGGDTA
ncbi:MAG TPA: tryptophan synthase subunit alpha [Longimicrobiales bacterium]|nr:tryptophan synthase subunit alpha [Longimicrobiales bacterium]